MLVGGWLLGIGKGLPGVFIGEGVFFNELVEGAFVFGVVVEALLCSIEGVSGDIGPHHLVLMVMAYLFAIGDLFAGQLALGGQLEADVNVNVARPLPLSRHIQFKLILTISY